MKGIIFCITHFHQTNNYQVLYSGIDRMQVIERGLTDLARLTSPECIRHLRKKLRPIIEGGRVVIEGLTLYHEFDIECAIQVWETEIV